MARRINILELRSVAGTGGGPEKTIMLGAALANRTQFTVTVCYIRNEHDPAYRLDERAKKLAIDYVELRERHALDPATWRSLRKLTDERQIDIVHSHDYKTDALAYFLGKRTGVIPLATSHGWSGDDRRAHWVYYPVDKRLLVKFPFVIAVSSPIRDELLRHGASADRVEVILNSIDGSVFRRDVSKRVQIRSGLGYAPNHIVIGAVGRLEYEKRFDLLLEAVAALAPRIPFLRVAIVGDGALRESLPQLAARFGIPDRCQFLGHREDMVDLYQAFDLFVQSSIREGTPNCVLEAMATETPIVATDVGGTRELASDSLHAILIEKGSLTELIRAIEHVIVDPKGARIRVEAARLRIDTELSFEPRTRRLEAIYQRLAGPRLSDSHA